MAKWAFLFPGQGSQYVGMGKDLRQNFKVAADVFAEADEALHEELSKLCFEGPEEELKLTRNTQPAILTVSIAALQVLRQETGLVPAMTAGHSLGEYSSLVASGALTFADAVLLVRKRGIFMQEAVPVGVGGMAAIMGLQTDVLEKICRECAEGQVVAPANYNSPGQIAISGHMEAVKRAAAKAETAGARKVVILPVSAPFHSSLMKPAAEKLAEVFEPIIVQDLAIPVLSNVEADFYPYRDDVKRLLIAQVDHPVRWIEEMEKMIREGVDRCLEIGPGKVLNGLMRKISRATTVQSIETQESIQELASGL
jgi:[acyl-carrier-protein] S-malonyltransferase